MERTLAKKITTNLFIFYILGYFYLFFILFVTLFFCHVTLFSIAKKLLHIARNKIKRNHDNWLKKKSYSKSKNVKKMPKKHNIFSLKIQKDAGVI